MKPERPSISFEEYENRETFVEKYKRKIQRNPFLSAGLLGLGGMLVGGAYKYKQMRAQGMSVSIFLINLRVAAQGTVVAALFLGLMSHFVNEQLTASESNNPKKR